jgi:hypothetical protein
MKKIDKLTPDQEAKVPQYLKKWLDNGRKTSRLDQVKAKQAIIDIYECAGMKPPQHFFFFPSPIQCQLAVNLMKNKEFEKILASNLETNLWTNLETNLWTNLGTNLRTNLWTNELKYENTFYGNHWTWWVGFYDFVLNELFEEKISEYKDFIKYLNALQQVHLFIPYDNIVFISDNPESLTLDTQGRLHGETAPAMMYQDGYSLFYLNGIQVPKWAIETPKDDIKPKQILELTNTEQRMALMRFVGLSKFLVELKATELHSYEGYKLYRLDVENQVIGPYLYMKCPSSGREFLEGVGDPKDDITFDKTIKTCQDALKWRSMKASKNLMSKFNLKWTYHA